MALRLPEEVPTQEEELLLSSRQSPEPDWTLISPQGIFPLACPPVWGQCFTLLQEKLLELG